MVNFLYNLEQKLTCLVNNLLSELSKNVLPKMCMRELNAKQLGTKLSHQESNVKQACVLAFIVSDNVCIVTVITSDLSAVIILIDINL